MKNKMERPIEDAPSGYQWVNIVYLDEEDVWSQKQFWVLSQNVPRVGEIIQAEAGSDTMVVAVYHQFHKTTNDVIMMNQTVVVKSA